MFQVKTTFYSGNTKVTKVKDKDMTKNILGDLEIIAMHGYHNVQSIEVSKDNKIVMYMEN